MFEIQLYMIRIHKYLLLFYFIFIFLADGFILLCHMYRDLSCFMLHYCDYVYQLCCIWQDLMQKSPWLMSNPGQICFNKNKNKRERGKYHYFVPGQLGYVWWPIKLVWNITQPNWGNIHSSTSALNVWNKYLVSYSNTVYKIQIFLERFV